MTKRSLEFTNKGKYEQIIGSIESLPIIKTFIATGLLSIPQKDIILTFFKEVELLIKKDAAYRFHDSMKVLIEEKIGNTIAGNTYSSFVKISTEKLRLLIYALSSLQMLADLGDTIVDLKKDLSNKSLDQLYDLNIRSDSYLVNFLKKNINSVLISGKDHATVELFYIRWQEFIDYQSCTLFNKGLTQYIKNLKNAYAKISQTRDKLDLPYAFDYTWMKDDEYIASKGGTTYLLNLLRVISSDIKIVIDKFDKENSLFDYLNFTSDHVVDIATDNGYADLDSLLIGNNIKEANLTNNILQVVVFRELGIYNITPLNSEKYVAFLEDYYKKLLRCVFNTVSKSASINAKLFKPMVEYFFIKGSPSKSFAQKIILYLNRIN